MQYAVQITAHVNVFTHVVPDELERGLAPQVGKVLAVTRQEVVQPNDLVAVRQKTAGQVRPQKPGDSGNEHPHGDVLPTEE
jgi:hypothetical protein